ncbi:MFS transporter [Alkalicaulis satelles]|uniref:MFS transporter n=1 Tax=Alkalicaulis satelles TaxID=2609175 RepID=A0A5M6Z8Q5_9PROT|nr:MFS transporter [Alkalicaulis satelles]KAA5801026.1 MFS transporter [Alkalicaulis satelles]
MVLRLDPIPRPARFALFYAAFYIGFGAYLPYMPVWFEARGLSPELIGAAGAAAMAGRVLAAPLGAYFADRAARRRHAVSGFTLGSVLIFLAHIPAHEPWLIIALAGLAGGAFTGINPIVDAFAMSESRRRRFAFGPPRAIGSAAFILGNMGCGALISLIGGEAALYWTLTGAGLALIASFWLPEGRRAPAPPPGAPRAGLMAALLAGGMPLAFAASALIQGAHGFYYIFSAVAWKTQGIAPVWIGALWATGVAAEIVFFALSARYLARLNPALLIAIAGAAAVVRWIALAAAPPLPALFALQGLHALTFGASYLGFLRYAAEHVPERFAATTQAVNSALAGGLVLAAASLISGYAYEAFGAGGFAVMAIPSLAGMICALALAHRARNRP